MTNATAAIPPFDVALFDAGRTLIQPVGSIEKIYATYAEQSGIPLPELVPRIRHQFGVLFDRERREMALGADGYLWSDTLDRQMWRRLCFAVAEAIPGLTVDPQAWFEQLYDHFGKVDTWQPYPETLETLRRLRARGVRTAVVSNWDSRLHGILDALGITPLMDTVVVSASAGMRKPGAGIFELALARLDAVPGRTIMVGDSLTDDVDGARRASLAGVLVHRDAGPPPPGVTTIASLDELLPAS